MLALVMVALTSIVVSAPIAWAGTLADSPMPAYDHTETSEDGQYILVVLADNATGTYSQGGKAKPDPEIREKYSTAGLYRNDGSTTPLWTIDWYAFSVEVSSDGRHVVRYGPWAWAGEYDELALAFYEDGKELTRYAVSDLVAWPGALPHSVSHYGWMEDANFDDKRSRLSITTLHDERYVFDVTTGKIVSGARLFGRLSGTMALVVGGGMLAVVLVGVMLIVRTRRKQVT